MATKYGLHKPHDNWTWRYDFRVRGKRYRGSTRTHDYDLAEQYTHKLYNDIYLDRHEIKKIIDEIKIGDFVTRHVLALQADASPHHAYSVEHTLREFVQWMQERGVVNLSDISVEILEAFKIYQLNHVKKITVKNKLRVLNAMLNRAVRYGILKENVAKKVTPINGIQVNKIRFFTKEEIEKITKAFDDHAFKRFAYLKDFTEVALKTGMRRSGLINLEYKDVDIDKKKVYVRNKGMFTTKSYRERIIPLHTDLLPLFHVEKSGYVFLKGGKKFNPKTTTKNFGLMLKRLEIDNQAGIHTLRHTFASYLIMAGVSMRTVAEYLGHSTTQVTELYSHLSPEHLNTEINKLRF